MMGFKGCCCCCSFDSVVSDSVRPHRRQPTRLPCPWDSPGKNIGVGCHSLLHGIFPTQGLNPGLLHCRWILYQLSHQRSPHLLSILSSEHSVCKGPEVGTGKRPQKLEQDEGWGFQCWVDDRFSAKEILTNSQGLPSGGPPSPKGPWIEFKESMNLDRKSVV